VTEAGEKILERPAEARVVGEVEEVRAAAAVGRSETVDRSTPDPFDPPGEIAFVAARGSNGKRLDESSEAPEVVDVPVELLPEPSVSCDPGGEVPLGRAGIEVESGREENRAERADVDPSLPAEPEKDQVRPAIVHLPLGSRADHESVRPGRVTTAGRSGR